MPKILIFFAGQNTTLVDALADGARAVRFSEVEVRRASPGDEATSGAYEVLASVEELVPYDAIVLGLSSASEKLDVEHRRLLGELASVVPKAALQNKVGSAFVTNAEAAAGDAWPALTVMGDMGMLIVAPAGRNAEAATELGGRVAQVAAWIAHVRSHHQHAH